MIKYSFVIPAYNCKELTISAIKVLNFLKTTDEFSFEVILIDDGSDDGSRDYFAGKKYSFDFKYIYLERCGISSRSRSRNYGIKASTGDYIIFIDADIIVQPDYLIEIHRYISQVSNAVVIGQRLFLDHAIPGEKITGEDIFSNYNLENCSVNWAEFRYSVFNELSYNMNRLDYPFLFAQTCNIVYPRAALVEAGGFDETMIAWGIEDIELAYRVHKQERFFLLNPRMFVFHQFHGYQESVFVDENKRRGIHKNTDIFFEKHPEALPMSRDHGYTFFMSLATKYYDVEKKIPDNYKEVVIEFRNPGELEKIKSEIIRLCNSKNIKLLIYDYLENTDLDLWIQELGNRNSIPLYYPVSICSIVENGNHSLFHKNDVTRVN